MTDRQLANLYFAFNRTTSTMTQLLFHCNLDVVQYPVPYVYAIYYQPTVRTWLVNSFHHLL